MPIFDMKCKNCGHESKDELLQQEQNTIKCPMCGENMVKQPSEFQFTMTPGAISKAKKKIGNTLPPEYKTEGGCNVYKSKK